MRAATCNLCGAQKRSALARCPCAAGSARQRSLEDNPAVRPALAVAARVMLNVDANQPDRGDAWIYRRPGLTLVLALAGLNTWRQSGAGWPADSDMQLLVLAGGLAVVMSVLTLIFGGERVHEQMEKLKRLKLG